MKFTGVMPALITPLTDEGKLNRDVLERLIEDLIAQGADGFYIGGATGEGIILDVDVHKELTTESIKIVNGRVPCIVHIARMNYNEMVDLAVHAEKAGADAISAIPPLFYQYDHQAIYNYYEGLSNAINIPIMIYNNPNTGVHFSAEQVAELYNIKNVTAIKWTNYEFYQVMRILDLTNDEFNVISGPDEMLLCGLAAGADGCIGTTYNFLMPEVRAVYDAFRAGDMEGARKAQTVVSTIVDELIKYNVVLATKVILEAKGYDVNHPLYPMHDYTPEQKAEMLANLQKAGLKL
ncbi:MAG: dihydrodipicolinate synthase family protein [Clostridia bacterium]|nr:dihydrodipicolinate synthase family protein [Clostridia bacterium]MBR4072221.1 dihydrodipicolinate synthase family protein [Clostridia bacterium]MBR6649858.1 dihydrodipicolinate synthase family protein [Clostridia bacterium]